MRARAHPHHFLSVTKQGLAAIVATRGNPRLPRHPARRRAAARTTTPTRVAERGGARCAKAGAAAARDGRLQPRQQRARTTARQPAWPRDVAAPDRAAAAAIVRRDAREPPGRRPPGPRARRSRSSTARASPTPAWRGRDHPVLQRPGRAVRARRAAVLLRSADQAEKLRYVVRVVGCPGESNMDIRLIYLPSGGLAETHGNVVRLTTSVRRGARCESHDQARDSGRDRRRGRGGRRAAALSRGSGGRRPRARRPPRCRPSLGARGRDCLLK